VRERKKDSQIDSEREKRETERETDKERERGNTQTQSNGLAFCWYQQRRPLRQVTG
jgi:hypothetical protein